MHWDGRRRIVTTQDEKALRQFLQDREDAVWADHQQGVLARGLQKFSAGNARLFLLAYLMAIADIKEMYLSEHYEVSRLPHDYIPDPRIVQDGDPPTRDVCGFPLE